MAKYTKRDATFRSAVVLSAERSDLSDEENRGRTAWLSRLMARYGFAFHAAEGAYKGATERSFIVSIGVTGDLAELERLARLFNQESILRVTYEKRALLKMLATDEVISLGVWTAVSESDALASDAWTKTGGKYYVAK